ncbi:hypothetical protein C1H46_004424 [Malus baccata]|uniref:Uncharacterized protein n=1 Tax=Malus baccata TaxID=106549 RepID=A0A540NG40_MALBA|nr:hypothetical protein C1H46_004424 [Malus baccata]
MAFPKLFFILSLAMVLSLSSTHLSHAARNLLVAGSSTTDLDNTNNIASIALSSNTAKKLSYVKNYNSVSAKANTAHVAYSALSTNTPQGHIAAVALYPIAYTPN